MRLRSKKTRAFLLSGIFSMLALSCSIQPERPTVSDAEEFVSAAEDRLLDLWMRAGQAAWVQQNFISIDTNAIAATANAAVMAATTELATEAAQFNSVELPEALDRKLTLLKTSLAAVAPADPVLQQELAGILAGMEAAYGQGEYCIGEECLDLPQLEAILAESRETDELLDAWNGWRSVSPGLRHDYQRFVEIANAGAVELGFTDMGEMWRSSYDMEPDEFRAELERLWEQVRPLYESLHCLVRAELGDAYGTAIVDQAGLIPAHLLGNMWSQSWSNVYELVAPDEGGRGYDLTRQLERNGSICRTVF